MTRGTTCCVLTTLDLVTGTISVYVSTCCLFTVMLSTTFCTPWTALVTGIAEWTALVTGTVDTTGLAIASTVLTL